MELTKAGRYATPECCCQEISGLMPACDKATAECVATTCWVKNTLHLDPSETGPLHFFHILIIRLPTVTKQCVECWHIPSLFSV